jgi:hypothetical protein
MNALYATSADAFDVDNTANIYRVAREMKALGMERILWGIFFDDDSAAVDFLRDDMGFLVTKYDIFKDVIPAPVRQFMTPMRLQRNKRGRSWPHDMIVGRDGAMQPAWELTGTDGKRYTQNALCDMAAIKYAMEDIPADLATHRYHGRFLDVTYATNLAECYHPAHPMSRNDSRRYRNILLQYLNDIGLISGTECGAEMGVPYFNYNEGMMSPVCYRADDAGRRMTATYYGDDVHPRITQYILNPQYRAPLWELVYHDCIVSYWYWGDSSNCCPEYLKTRDLFNVLYGTPPLYSMDVDSWDALKPQIAESYQRTVPVVQHTGGSELLAFAYLTDDKLVQQTRFANGTTITANFAHEPYTMPDGTVIAALDYVVEAG